MNFGVPEILLKDWFIFMQESFHGYGGTNGILVRGRNVKTHTPQKSNELIPKIAMFKGSYLFPRPIIWGSR